MSGSEIVDVALLRLDPGVPAPQYARDGDAGADLATTENVEIAPGERVLVGTGVALALPAGWVGLVHPRSGLAARHGLTIVNAPGTVDSGYRGEIKVCLLNTDPRHIIALRRGDLIFWKGHVAIARDSQTIVHANAFHMATAIEPVRGAVDRIKAASSDVTSIKRL